MNAVSCIGWWHGFPQGAWTAQRRVGEQLGVLRLGGEALASAEWPDLLGGLSGRGFPWEVGSGLSGCPGGPVQSCGM